MTILILPNPLKFTVYLFNTPDPFLRQSISLIYRSTLQSSKWLGVHLPGPWAALVIFPVTVLRLWELEMQMGERGGTGQKSAETLLFHLLCRQEAPGLCRQL